MKFAWVSGENVQHSKLKATSYEPYTEGGVSDKFIAFPLSLPSEPITTAITSITTGNKSAGEWYSIDGRYLGKLRPSAPGIYSTVVEKYYQVIFKNIT